ncbi:MAG: SprT-like domain-containing protein [Lysobacterales bacterium]
MNTALKLRDLGAIQHGGSVFLGRTAQHTERAPRQLRPTETICTELQYLFDTFNRELFRFELPECVLTVDIACRSAYGYFRPDAFVNADGEIVDQISLNPKYMLTRPMQDVAGTVAHEMVHGWMHRCSERKPRGGYHCKRWGQKMKSIGLFPSNTGQPGGRQTGYQMTHFPIAGGPFLGVVGALESQGFAITWGRFQRVLEIGLPQNPEGDDPSKGKVKFACPNCRQVCWGSPSLIVICGNDRSRMLRPLE